MSILALMGKLFSFLNFKNFFQNYQRKSSLIRINAAKIYVLGVKKIRIFFIAVTLVLLSFVLLANGLFLIHSALFTYSNWSPEVKFMVALILGAAEALGAAGILFFLFKEETWVKFSEISKVVNAVIGKETETPRD